MSSASKKKRRPKVSDGVASAANSGVTIDKALIGRASRLLRILAPVHMPTIMDAVMARANEALEHVSGQAILWGSLIEAGDEGPLEKPVQEEAERYGVSAEEIREKFVAMSEKDPAFHEAGRVAMWLNSAYSLSKVAVAERHCFFATEETSALVLAGANDAITRVAATAADLPSPNGIAYFDRAPAVGGFFLLWGVRTDGLLQASVCSAPMLMGWLERDPKPIPGGTPNERGFWPLPFRQAKMSAAQSDEPPHPIDVSAPTTMKFESGNEPTPLTEDPLDRVEADLAVPILLSFAHMMRQHKLVDAEPESHPSKGPADRKGRRSNRLDTITYLSYRPRSKAKSESSPQRHYSHRWVVRGHWRKQWYPSLNRHIPIWITEYIAGPEDSPIRVRDKVGLV
ncbi:hypothetical protein [Rhodococcus sp. JT-3]|uniref:hypothetical protein n=1 Tax=Rhodococcus sp. JT-3 TaxID=1973213 RepID=UPI0013031598|nr:hypothetical protein [Rhodococcus sp. JT-3]